MCQSEMAMEWMDNNLGNVPTKTKRSLSELQKEVHQEAEITIPSDGSEPYVSKFTSSDMQVTSPSFEIEIQTGQGWAEPKEGE